MPFGEYELSPSLIGLSLLHTPHREAFQRLSVRPSRECYLTFSLDMCRSLGFASTPADSTPYSGSLSLRLRASWRLTSPAMVTRRFIMQKARRHTITVLRPLVGAWFQVLFHSPARGASHLSLTVLVHYRSHGSIQPCRVGPADSRRIPRVPRYSGSHWRPSAFVYRIVTFYDASFQTLPLRTKTPLRGPTTPTARRHADGLG